MAPGKFFLPGDGKPVVPALLPIKSPGPGGRQTDNRSAQLAHFLESDASEAFSRNAANRIFGLLMGRHLVDSPDDHRLGNPAVHESILELLATRFREADYRLRPLIEFISTSEFYAVGSNPPGRGSAGADPQLQYLARREARPLSGDEFVRALTAVLGIEEPALEPPGTPLALQTPPPQQAGSCKDGFGCPATRWTPFSSSRTRPRATRFNSTCSSFLVLRLRPNAPN